MKSGNSVWLFILIVILGMVIGNVLNELILLIPVNILTKIFSTGFPLSLNNTTFNLKVLELNFGLTLQANVGSAFGILLGFYLYRWITK